MIAPHEEDGPIPCPSCGSKLSWTPTFCNHAHCAECFAGIDEEHRAECGWDGSEHASYFPLDHGNVWNGSCLDCCENSTGNDDGQPCDKHRGTDDEETSR